jgi:dimethylargininase
MIALTRDISPEIVRCELTHLVRVPIDLSRARSQHQAYERALAALGCTVERLPADIGMPDSVFIEDTAVVVDEVAVVTRPGAMARRVEIPAVADWLAGHRELALIEAPGTLDGGDVLIVGRAVFAGLSRRSNRDGIAQLRQHLAPFGYETTAVAVDGCLHLKSAVTALSDDTVLVNRAWVDAAPFSRFEIVEVEPQEPFAANVLRAPKGLLYASAFPRTLARLAARGLAVSVVDNSELAKAEGAMTCGALLIRDIGRKEVEPSND